jgi:hypothetical protein
MGFFAPSAGVSSASSAAGSSASRSSRSMSGSSTSTSGSPSRSSPDSSSVVTSRPSAVSASAAFLARGARLAAVLVAVADSAFGAAALVAR